jgi:cell division septation protein DedD
VTGSPRQLPLSRLGHLIPPLVESQALVALVPTTADLVWAAKAAWDIARIAARGGRRVALVDLCVEEPTLHQTVGLSPSDGIVDAFEYGVSLAKAAHEVDGVFFIAAGSYTASASDLYAHPRWRKLQAGFRSEGALLLLFLSATGLGKLAAVADGAIVLAPEGLDPASTVGVELAAVVERGTPLLGVARDRWMPTPGPTPAITPLPESPPAGRRNRGARAAVATLALAGAAVGGWSFFATAREAVQPPAQESTPSVAVDTPIAAIAAGTPAPAPVVHADTLCWTIQLAAYGTAAKALAHADQFAGEHGIGALVTPVQQGRARTVWYRVLVGSFKTREAAAAARDEMWRQGTTARGIGDLLRAPYSYAPVTDTSLSALRRLGLPAVRWRNRVLIGAFETPEQAAFTESKLTRARVRATLLPRVGTTP